MKPSVEALQGRQWLLLEQIAMGVPLPAILQDIVLFIESQSDGMKCSILLLDHDGTTLRHGAAPNLPVDYVRAIDGAQIGPAAGSCGTAAFRREPVIVEDVATHPYWEDYKHLILQHGYVASWSTPIFGKDQTVLGTFAMYYSVNRGPTAPEGDWVRVATHLAALAIERDRSDKEKAQLLSSLTARVEALRQSEERFSAVIGNSPHVGVQWYDADGRLLFANDASYRQLGWSGLEPLGKTLDELNFPPAEAARFKSEIAKVAKTGAPRGPLEFHFEREDGTPGILLSTVFQIPGPLGQPCFVCMDVDITAHRRAEERVRESEKLRALIFSTVSDVIFYLGVEPGPRYRFLSVNPAFSEATGVPESAVVGQLVDDVIPSESLAMVLQKYQEAIESRGSVSWLEVSDYAKGKKYGEVKVTPVFNTAGECTNLVGTVHDITRFKNVEEERHRLEVQLQQMQRVQALGTLASGVAHDFNNILTAILAHADLALIDPSKKDVSANLAAIRHAGQRGSDLVRRLLRYSRKDDPFREPLELAQVVDEAIELLRAGLPSGVELKAHFPSDLPLVLADPTQVHQIVVNLCTNAIQAMSGGGGTVELDATTLTCTTPDGDLSPGNYVCLTVTDTGAGMDAETLDRIFEPFFTTKPAGHGTGLGLSVVQGIMDSHGGTVRVESRLGKGTTFRLYFPSAPPDREEGEEMVPSMRTGAGRHVFYIDDDEDLLFLTSMMLRRLGYRVTTFSSAADMLTLLADEDLHVDAVVSDVSMPGANGPRLIAEVRRLRPNIRAVLVSGYARPEDLRAAHQLGISDILSKPNSVEAFARFLSDLFSPDGEPSQNDSPPQ